MTSGVLLPVAFRDACADELRLHLGLPRQAALATRQIDGDGWTADLRILGASHQVLVTQGERVVCSETVACQRAEEGHRLDASPLGGPDYEFRATIVRLAPGEFRRRVRDLLGERAGDARGLCGRFPGDELGATALRLDPVAGQGGSWLSWQTWHTYPRTGEVVATSSRTALRATVAAGQT